MIKLEITSHKKVRTSYKDTCHFMGYKHLLLVSAKDTAHLDCMGSKLNAGDYCRKKVQKDKKLLRGYVNKVFNEVVCDIGESVHLAIACDKEHKFLCKRPRKSCLNLKRIYAERLDLVHHSFLEKDVDNVLNCYYGKVNSR